MASLLRAAATSARRSARHQGQIVRSQAPLALFSTNKPEVKTSFSEILDRATNIFFLTELMRGFWLSFEVSMKPKVCPSSGEPLFLS